MQTPPYCTQMTFSRCICVSRSPTGEDHLTLLSVSVSLRITIKYFYSFAVVICVGYVLCLTNARVAAQNVVYVNKLRIAATPLSCAMLRYTAAMLDRAVGVAV